MANDPDPLDTLFSRASEHGIPIAAICERTGIAPTTPSRWRNGKNGPTLDRLGKMNEALNAIIAERKRRTPDAQVAA